MSVASLLSNLPGITVLRLARTFRVLRLFKRFRSLRSDAPLFTSTPSLEYPSPPIQPAPTPRLLLPPSHHLILLNSSSQLLSRAPHVDAFLQPTGRPLSVRSFGTHPHVLVHAVSVPFLAGMGRVPVPFPGGKPGGLRL